MAGNSRIHSLTKRIHSSNIIWSVLAVLMNAGINLLIVPYITSYIGVSAYGFVSLSANLISYVDIVSMALNSFAGRYIAVAYHRGDRDGAKRYYSSLMLADAVLCGLILVPAAVLIWKVDVFLQVPEELLTDVQLLFIVVLVRYFTIVMRNALDVATFICNRLDLTGKLRTISYVIQAAALILFYTYGGPRIWFTGMASLLAAVFLFLTQLYLKCRLTPELQTKVSLFSWGRVLEFVRMGIWNSVNSIGNVLNSGLDLLVTNLMLDSVLMGDVSVAKTVATMSLTLLYTVSDAMKPRQLQAYSEGNREELIARLKRSMALSGGITALIFAGFLSCGMDFLGLWIPGQDIEIIYRLTVISLAGYLVIGAVYPLYYVYTLTEKVSFPCLLTIGMGCANVAGMFLLIRYTGLGVYAVVLTTMVLDCLHIVDAPLYSAWCLRQKWHTFYPVILEHFVRCAVTLGLLVGLDHFWPEVNGWGGFLLKAMVLGLAGTVTAVPFRTLRRET